LQKPNKLNFDLFKSIDLVRLKTFYYIYLTKLNSMNKKQTINSVFLILLTATSISFGQNLKPLITVPKYKITDNAATKSAIFQSEFIGFRNSNIVDKNWRPTLANIISKNEGENEEELEKLQEKKDRIKFKTNINNKVTQVNETLNTTASINPVLGTNFIGIDNGGNNAPLDNTIAVSNGGYIVTCVNSHIEYDDVNGNYFGGQTLVSLINDATLSTNLCDPKVIYDSGADRFIFFVQTCDGSYATSKIVIGFSKTSNPLSGWWVYKLTGNPLNNNKWFDYPKIAVSNNELYITGNLYSDNPGASFDQAILYQIEKINGFNGTSFNYQVWNNFAGAPSTLLPVSNGQQGNYGPGIYLVNSKAVTAGSTNINLYDLTNDMNAANETILHYNVSTTNYSTAGNAQQLGSSIILKTGDSRTMAGFYLNGVIHFVFHSDIGNGYNGINYNRLDVATATNVSSTFGLAGTYEYCFPAVASIGETATDKDVIISFSRSGATIYPEVRAIACDNLMNWSNSITVKEGLSFIDYSWTSSTVERWGDYSGIARKFNSSPPSVWVSGDYANSSNYWNQWIGEITTISTIGVSELSNQNSINTSIYPNPIIDTYKIEFEMPGREQIEIEILDLKGKVIKELYNGLTFDGKNLFTFNKSPLTSGVYFIKISSKNKTLKNEKIVILEK
jgi:hypothetical protein